MHHGMPSTEQPLSTSTSAFYRGIGHLTQGAFVCKMVYMVNQQWTSRYWRGTAEQLGLLEEKRTLTGGTLYSN